MADPVTWFTIGSAVFSAMGAMSQANAKSDEQNSIAEANQFNAETTRQRAETALQLSNSQEEAQRRKARGVLGTQRAALAQSGLDVSGSGGDVYEQSAGNAELDALSIRYEGVLNSKGLTDQASLYDRQAENARRNASSAQTAGLLGAGAALTSGYGSYLKGSAKLNPNVWNT